MADWPTIPSGFGYPLVDMTTKRLPDPTMDAIQADAAAAIVDPGTALGATTASLIGTVGGSQFVPKTRRALATAAAKTPTNAGGSATSPGITANAAGTTVSSAGLAIGTYTLDGIHPAKDGHLAMSAVFDPSLLEQPA